MQGEGREERVSPRVTAGGLQRMRRGHRAETSLLPRGAAEPGRKRRARKEGALAGGRVQDESVAGRPKRPTSNSGQTNPVPAGAWSGRERSAGDGRNSPPGQNCTVVLKRTLMPGWV